MQNLGKRIMIFDGGLGSEIEAKGLSSEIPEDLNFTHSKEIQEIHSSYRNADFITTNTFGLNRIKYKGQYSIKEVALKAIENARVTQKKVFFDIGPTGAMLEPIGAVSFEQAYEAFKEIVLITKDLVDGYIVETFSDLYEIKACILAIKENSNRPVFATMTFAKEGRTLTGSTPEIVVNTLEGLNVDALGLNCSLGPKEMEPIVQRIIDFSHTPIIVQPNRGLPVLRNGKTYYDLSLEEFDYYIKKYCEMGVSIIGGCCGTTPLFIEEIAKYKGQKVRKVENEYLTVINSRSRSVNIDGVKICGERLNPTGKKRLKEALLNEDYEYLVDEAIKQENAGADVLDLNVGVPKIDEKKLMQNAVKKIQEYISLPLQIDSSDKDAIEAGVRSYDGIPLINSVNGEDSVMERVFPIAKKYGAVVLGLTMDENGVPKTAKERFDIAKKIIEKADSFGIKKHKIIIDTLVLTASAEQMLVKETIEALRLVKSLGVKTALGVSNVSFGLPNRGLLNKTFLTMAMTNGLNLPIINPLDKDMLDSISAFKVLNFIDVNAEEYINKFQTQENVEKDKQVEEKTLYNVVLKGLKNQVCELTRKELEKQDAMSVINDILIPALQEAGELYDRGVMFLPQLISTAEAAKEAFSEIMERFPKSAVKKGRIVLATVKGDVHDIGKNIVKVVLESYGYDVVDLGKDTPIEKVVEAYKTLKPSAIGLSALMTTTVVSMEETIKELKKVSCTAPIFVGGAVLTEEIAKEIGADYYSKNALDFVKILEKIMKQ